MNQLDLIFYCDLKILIFSCNSKLYKLLFRYPSISSSILLWIFNVIKSKLLNCFSWLTVFTIPASQLPSKLSRCFQHSLSLIQNQLLVMYADLSTNCFKSTNVPFKKSTNHLINLMRHLSQPKCQNKGTGNNKH